MSRKLLVASSNQGKIREIRKMMDDLDYINIVSPADFPDISRDIVEDGENFTENALKKARIRAEETGVLTLADDSGLVVDYLNGRPGVYSARYAGENADDHDNNVKLLEELEDVQFEERRAHFVCVAALVDPEKENEYSVKEKCSGYILSEQRGEQGFGYDPLFYVPEYEKTMAELSVDVKNMISHRAKAVNKVRKLLINRYSE